MSLIQAPSAVVMMRPHAFRPNPETEGDNHYQSDAVAPDAEVSRLAQAEFDGVVDALREVGVTVHVFEEEPGADTPDCVFPNNWFSTHAGGRLAVYPMFAANRQRERRWDVIEELKRLYRVQDVIDYSGLEQDGLSLEGTGAMVLDHVHRIAYTAESNRADPVLLERFCTHFNFEPMAFRAVDGAGHPVYHTNVMMTLGHDFALVCMGMIEDPGRRRDVGERLLETRHDVIDLTLDQVANFAGNALELTGESGRVLALSSRAAAALSPEQVTRIERSARLLPMPIPTLELAGGSIRCMLAGVHLSARSNEPSP